MTINICCNIFLNFQMSTFSTLTKRIINSFPSRIGQDPALPTGIARLPGAFVNQGNVQNLQVTIKNYNYPSKFSDYENPEFSQTEPVKNDNFEKITVIKNLYYE